MQLDRDFLNEWEQIVSDVDKQHVPIECVKKVVFRHSNGRQKTINLKSLKRQNLIIDEIALIVERYISENEDEIVSMEFVVDVIEVAKI